MPKRATNINSLLFASTNSGKFVEVKEVLAPIGIKVVNPTSLKLKSTPPKVVEDGQSYLENATLKAEAYLKWSNHNCLADDAGLEVEALKGGPGIYSARYAGEEASSLSNNLKLLHALRDAENRTARFVCVLMYIALSGERISTQGEIEGTIAKEMSGCGGFGYDCLFIPRGYKETLADLKSNKIEFQTHRICALNKLLKLLAVD